VEIGDVRQEGKTQEKWAYRTRINPKVAFANNRQSSLPAGYFGGNFTEAQVFPDLFDFVCRIETARSHMDSRGARKTVTAVWRFGFGWHRPQPDLPVRNLPSKATFDTTAMDAQ
jgi:hypothetical protein